MYTPAIADMNRIDAIPISERHTAVLFGDIESIGSIEYAWLVTVFDHVAREPVYFVASEVNAMASVFGTGSHFLGVFEGEKHHNLGASNDWADPEKFFARALELVHEKFGPGA